jgi:hypothetical protein
MPEKFRLEKSRKNSELRESRAKCVKMTRPGSGYEAGRYTEVQKSER